MSTKSSISRPVQRNTKSKVIRLNGITWNHTRGFLPMAATAQRFSEMHPKIEIVWQKRSLQQFADFPIQKLAEEFDLLIIDHPFVGYASKHSTLLPLDEYLPSEFLKDQAENSVGKSHESYYFGNHQWALAIDAATPVSSYRPDLLEPNSIPKTWEELLNLAKAGRVMVPSIPIDSLMNFYMLCIACGEEPFTQKGRLISQEIGIEALETLRELISYCPPVCLKQNPIHIYEHMVLSDRIAYCPFAYGYSNYARDGYAAKSLSFGGLVTFQGKPLRSTLGGTGLAISSRCQNIQPALEYSQFVASSICQQGIYFSSGGQPGHRHAWNNIEVNTASGNFFKATLETLDHSYLRPRYCGYLDFQDHAGLLVHQFLCKGGDAKQVLKQMEDLYLSTL